MFEPLIPNRWIINIQNNSLKNLAKLLTFLNVLFYFVFIDYTFSVIEYTIYYNIVNVENFYIDSILLVIKILKYIKIFVIFNYIILYIIFVIFNLSNIFEAIYLFLKISNIKIFIKIHNPRIITK